MSHISMLKKCIANPSLIVPTKNIGIKDNLSYEDVLVKILDRQVRKMRTKTKVRLETSDVSRVLAMSRALHL
ncbi:hypothetical protein MTR67_011927 [Solanum verrucosum]|uniref:Uncharacterized protein n=1 Tax=Solanum verrucosum TaxID=315347 RepID=A0AAF0Q8Z4_SOLVR|nr:hypothetical protein MTR67_011927 [Solanum verrucosum]